MTKTPLVSVNIPTYNSANTLKETLKSVKNQTYKNIEIIVADGHSTDGTIKIAKKYGAKVFYAQELGRARRQAFFKSRGRYILFLDSDQIMDERLIERGVAEFEKKDCDAITLSERSIVRKGTLVEKLIAYDKFLVDSLRDDDAVFGTAIPRFFTMEILKGISWPKKLCVFDDTAIFLEITKRSARVEYLSAPAITHHEVDTWTKYFKKFYRYGYFYFEAFKNYPSQVAAHSLPRRAYFTKVALNKPHYFFGLLALYIVKGIAAFIGIISYFWQKITD